MVDGKLSNTRGPKMNNFVLAVRCFSANVLRKRNKVRNTARSGTPAPQPTRRRHTPLMRFCASRDIRAGEEFFINYGPGYFMKGARLTRNIVLERQDKIQWRECHEQIV